MKYTIFIIFGILLFLFNLHETFNIGIVNRIPIGRGDYLTRNSEIRFTDSKDVEHTPNVGEHFNYEPLDNIYLENGQWYFYTDTDINLPNTVDDTLLQQIRDSINNEIDKRRKREKKLNAFNRFNDYGLNSLNEYEINLLLDTEIPLDTEIQLSEDQIDLLNSRLFNITHGIIEINLLGRNFNTLNIYDIYLTFDWTYYQRFPLGNIADNIWKFKLNDLITILFQIVVAQRKKNPYQNILCNF